MTPSALSVPQGQTGPKGDNGIDELVYKYTVVGSDKASIDTAIDSPDAGSNVWTDGDVLEVYLASRTDEAVAVSVINLLLNNNTGGVYDKQTIAGTASSASSAGVVGGTSLQTISAGASAIANLFSHLKLEIADYLSTNWKSGKISASVIDSGASFFTHELGVAFRITTGITRLSVAPATSGKKFKVGTQLLIYKRRPTLADTALPTDGWVSDMADTWTYASADSPTFTFTVPGDRSTVLTPGTRIKLTQTTVKYFIVTAVSYSAGTTTVTVYGGTDYTLANATISANYHSLAKAPGGFPLDPTKWQLTLSSSTQRNQASPVSGTWYNAESLDIHIGIWDVYYQAQLQGVRSGDGTVEESVTLSTTNNSESDSEMTFTGQTSGAQVPPTSGISHWIPCFRRKTIVRTSKATYYLNMRADVSGMSNVEIRGDFAGKTIIRAVCAYL